MSSTAIPAALGTADRTPVDQAASAADPAGVTLPETRLPVDARGLALGVLAALAFISLLFCGWLWGVWGMLLSIPIIVIVKVVSQHVEQLHPMAELLGD